MVTDNVTSAQITAAYIGALEAGDTEKYRTLYLSPPYNMREFSAVKLDGIWYDRATAIGDNMMFGWYAVKIDTQWYQRSEIGDWQKVSQKPAFNLYSLEWRGKVPSISNTEIQEQFDKNYLATDKSGILTWFCNEPSCLCSFLAVKIDDIWHEREDDGQWYEISEAPSYEDLCCECTF